MRLLRVNEREGLWRFILILNKVFVSIHLFINDHVYEN